MLHVFLLLFFPEKGLEWVIGAGPAFGGQLAGLRGCARGKYLSGVDLPK
jgi:hypothetical protein